jgi:putative autoinducer-2 (AI-2) aldolase
MADGKKLPERDALTMAYNAIENGAAGVDMGLNIFQSDTPQAMIRAVRAVVHESMKPDEAYALFLQEPAAGAADRAVDHVV